MVTNNKYLSKKPANETERLKLVLLDERHISAVYNYFVRNKKYFTKWLCYPVDFYNDKVEIQTSLKQERQLIEYDMGIRLWMFKKDDDKLENVIGSVSCSNILREHHQTCTLGYMIDEKHIGKGYATEAVEYFTNYIFNILKLHKIECQIMPENLGSMKVIEKVGFKLEGYEKKALLVNGEWKDHFRYALINEKM